MILYLDNSKIIKKFLNKLQRQNKWYLFKIKYKGKIYWLIKSKIKIVISRYKSRRLLIK